MKKVYAIFFALMTLAGLQGKAQLTQTCNPDFSFQFLTSTTVKMNPAVVTDSPYVQHYWSFGDGSANANQISPSHNYAPGVYQVKHYVIRHNPNNVTVCMDSLTKTLTIAQACNLSAAFTAQVSTANTLSVAFTNTSVAFATGDSIRWTFGDGTVSYDLNPTHTYANGGTYNVCLRVKRNSTSPTTVPCVSEICHTISVTAPNPCNYQAYYTFTIANTNQPNVIQFTNQTGGYLSTDSVTWTFGDGTTSHDVNPIHIYTTAGTYHVCILVKRTVPGAVPCVREYCRDIAVTVPVVCTLSAAFTSAPVASNSMIIHFTNTSTGFVTGDSIRWTFGDGTVSYETNPTHTYANAGVYNVCLRVKKNNTNASATPCVSEICHTVVISAPCNLSVSWTSTAAAGQPNVIQFNNTSTGYAPADTIQWTFGDGSTGTVSNPLHTYANAGTYQVCLIIRKAVVAGTAPCANYSCHTITVTLPCTLTAAFTSQASTANPLSVLFTNTSTGFASGDSIRWNFGDGTVSYDVNPTHVYTTAGTYNVCLRVKKNSTSATAIPCVSEICHTVTIVAPCNIQAYYSYTTDATQPNLIHFTNQSPGYASTDSITWTFGDGTSSHDLNPNHLYTTGGTYHVCVLIKRTTTPGTAPCIREYCRDIAVTVPAPCTLTASFTFTHDTTGLAINNFHFTNTSTGFSSTDSIRWTFGDGASSNAVNPNHVYAQPGTYTVCLRVQKRTSNGTLLNCVSEFCHAVVFIPVVPCSRLANFHALPVTTVIGANVFVPNAIFNDVQYTWTFGDGTGSHDVTATHTYAQPGTYTVCLTAYRSNSCAATSCMSVQVTSLCNYYSLNATEQRDSLNPNRVTFSAVSNGAITDQVWTISKIPASGTPITIHANNPTYVFADSGYYNVCVHVTYANGCVKDFCKTIHILQNLPGTNSCTLQVFPNPASTSIGTVVTLPQPGMINAYVYSSTNVLLSQSQQQGVAGNNTISVNIAALTPGVYVLRVVYGNSVCYATFIKQ